MELLILLVIGGGVLAAVIALLRRGRGRPGRPVGPGPVCRNPDCGAANDPGAKFCRRCGKELDVG